MASKKYPDVSAKCTDVKFPDAYSRVFYLVEGDLSSTNLPHETLLGACIDAELRDGVHVTRTACTEETGMVAMQLVKIRCTSERAT